MKISMNKNLFKIIVIILIIVFLGICFVVINKKNNKGKFLFIQGMYDIAKENNSFGYAIINRDINIPQYNVDYKKGEQLTIDEVYSLFNVIGTK